MAGLDINYLDLVRESLYNKKTKQREAVKKRKKPDLTEPSSSGGPQRKIKPHEGTASSEVQKSCKKTKVNTQNIELKNKCKKDGKVRKKSDLAEPSGLGGPQGKIKHGGTASSETQKSCKKDNTQHIELENKCKKDEKVWKKLDLVELSGSGGPQKKLKYGGTTSSEDQKSCKKNKGNTQNFELENKCYQEKKLSKHNELMFKGWKPVSFKIKKREEKTGQKQLRNINKPWSTETLKHSVTLREEIESPQLLTTPPHDFYDDHSVTVKGLSFTKLSSPFRSTKLLNTTKFVIPKKYLKNNAEETTMLKVEKSSEVLTPEVQKQHDVQVTENPIKENEVKKVILPDKQSDGQEKQVTGNPRKNEVKKVILPDDTIITILDFNQTVYFNCASIIQVLYGEIEVLGAVINANHGEKPVYSPRGSSLLYLRNTRDFPGEQLISLPQTQLLTFQEDCAVVQFKPLKNHSLDFIQRHISQKILLDKIDFELSGAFSLTKTSAMWRGVVKTMGGYSKVAICGGKGVGKSTLLRYCINSLLGRFDKVVVVDLDPGQSEFFPPGCLSITTVSEMVLGPNYTHLQTPDCAVLSHINMAHDVRKYIEAVKYLLNQLTTGDVPVLINFSGFTQGIGLTISATVLKLLQPNRVIEIKGKNVQKNYAIDLTGKNVNRIGMLEGNEEMSVSYEYTKLESLAEKSGAWSLEARQAREFCVLSYFGRMMSENVRQLTSCDIAMININISALHFVNQEGNSISPLVVNANVVALCCADPNTGLYICQGFGFVRGVDLDNNTLVLLTPEPFERLNSVTHLVLSSVTTPPSLLMQSEGVKGRVPYVSFGALVDFGQLTKRPYLPPRK